MLEVKNLRKVYKSRFGLNVVEAIKNVSFKVDKGEYVVIMGESGSGKTTLLNILATIDTPTSGSVVLDGIDMNKGSEAERALFRRTNLGFVFQDFNLLESMNNMDNIFLPLVLSEYKVSEMRKRLGELTQKLGISEIITKYPYEVSGGQKQRVAVARAVITNPKILLADEPTGALDSRSSQQLLELFENLNEEGQTIIMVTHSAHAASRAKRILFIKDGIISHELYKGNLSSEEFYKQIINTQGMLLSGGERIA
ncbi:ABC transporter ATP-binding protein [Microaceticoccus formicicus]|uniref:ABC transporter ATP-binding protein n=1 Tax=Microaceticoccus formicicus TaxID=3118105 RepID=UPI003CD0219A|nr:ABC transporter ATP-binding protein [Peptoniphilaceae bacterium AMB_02]